MPSKKQTRRKQSRKTRKLKDTRKLRNTRKQRGSGFFNKVKSAFQKKATVVPYTSSNIVVPAKPANNPMNNPVVPNEPKKPKRPIKLAILTVKLELLDRSNNNGHINTNTNSNSNSNYNSNIKPNELIDWYEETGFDVIEFHGYTDPVIEHIKGDLYQIAFVPSPEESEEDIEFNAEMIADVDDDGNYPIHKGNKTYLVAGQVQNVEFEYE
jgi:hypothetical protein